jgi:hypothetical protein
MKIISALAALACCGTTLSLAFGPAVSGMAAHAATQFTALTAHPVLNGLDLPAVLALLGALVVFASSACRSEDR